MKQLFFSLFFIALFGNAATAADTPSSPVLRSFHKTFAQAKDVSWTTGSDLFVVNFRYNNQHITAYYAVDGEMVVMTKNILSTQLPLMLEASLKENYTGYWISSVVECSNNEGVNYYVTVENADQKVVLVSAANSWNVQTRKSK